jgi:hypothetical protein
MKMNRHINLQRTNGYFSNFKQTIVKGKFIIKGTNLSEDFIEILYHANFDVIPLLNHLSNHKRFYFYGFKYLCSSLSININQFKKFLKVFFYNKVTVDLSF